jgi:hypothetical protein
VAQAKLPKDVRRLIARHIDSIQQVEILALLLRERERDWSSAEISRALQIPIAACENWLDRFLSAEILSGGNGRVRLPGDGREARSVAELVELHSRRRMSVIDAIYGRPPGSG